MNQTPKREKELAGRMKIGPAGWAYRDWSGIVYPKHKPRGWHEAGYLAQYFDTIEINTSFYQPLQPQHCQQWLEWVSANPHFLFTAKLWQKFTHETNATAEDERSVRTGFDVLQAAETSLNLPLLPSLFVSLQ